ncbi:MAG: hypothetical protein QM713_09740 [Arachnia sp.]
MSPLDRVVEARPELALSVGRRPTGPGWQGSDLAFQPDGWAAVLRQADAFFSGWPYRDLVAFREDPDEVRFTLGVCCLIYKSPTGHRCDTCCLPDPVERRTERWVPPTVGSR